MQELKVNILSLKSVSNYASNNGVTTSYIYKLIKESKISSVDIDGVKFIDIQKYPTIKSK